MAEQDWVQAKQGDDRAIAKLLQGAIAGACKVQVRQKNGCLQVLLESGQVPDRRTIVPVLHRVLSDLDLPNVQQVRVYGRTENSTAPAWTTVFQPGVPLSPPRQLTRQLTAVPVPSQPRRSPKSFNLTFDDVRRWSGKLDPWKAGFMMLLTIYGWFGAPNYTVAKFLEPTDRVAMFLHGVNLIFHEAGHVIFMVFGQFIGILGGSLFQILVPAFIAGYFFVTRQFYAGAIALCWTGQNFWDVSVYVQDAAERVLPLLGGASEEYHDWYNLLTDMNLLDRDDLVAGLVFWIGSLLYLVAIGLGFYFARLPQKAPANPVT